jgi:hypothetical protein
MFVNIYGIDYFAHIDVRAARIDRTKWVSTHTCSVWDPPPTLGRQRGEKDDPIDRSID